MDPAANLAAVRISSDGVTATLHYAPNRLFERATSEWNTHLAVHDDAVERTGTNFHAIVHPADASDVPQPHLPIPGRGLPRPAPAAQAAGDDHHLPAGVGDLPFMLPGSAPLMEANVTSLRAHRIVVWAKHGVMARSSISVKRAVDRIECAETAANYEYMDLLSEAGPKAFLPMRCGRLSLPSTWKPRCSSSPLARLGRRATRWPPGCRVGPVVAHMSSCRSDGSLIPWRSPPQGGARAIPSPRRRFRSGAH